MKIIGKVLLTRTENILPLLISSNQTTFFENRFIRGSRKVISDILEIANTLALEVLLATVDIEKAFDYVNNCFLLEILRKFGFGKDFVSWIKAILKNQEFYIINGRKTRTGLKIFRQEFILHRLCR